MAPANPNKRKEILGLPDKGSSRSREVLVKLFRDMLGDLQIREDTWDRLLKHFLSDPANGISQDPKERSSAQGNLNKALFSDTMTWRTFVKGIRVLIYLLVYARIEIHYQRPNGPVLSQGFNLIDRRNKKNQDNIDILDLDEPEEDEQMESDVDNNDLDELDTIPRRSWVNGDEVEDDEEYQDDDESL